MPAPKKQITLNDRILQIDYFQAKRFAKLRGATLEIASEGIIRHLRACAKMDVNPDASAVREILQSKILPNTLFYWLRLMYSVIDNSYFAHYIPKKDLSDLKIFHFI